MKKLLLCSAAVLGFATAASAADIPRRAAPVAPIYAPVPVFTWTGFYVGVNAGYGWGDKGDDCLGCFVGGSNLAVAVPGGTAPVALASDPFFPAGFGFGGRGNRDGFVGGAQVGYNFQFTPGSGLVLGVEADIQWADLGGDDNNRGFFGGFNTFHTAAPVFPAVPGSGIAVGGSGGNVALFDNAFHHLRSGIGGNDGNDWFATVRARVGWAFDRVLVYATGGIVFTEGKGDDNFLGFGTGIRSGAQIPASFYISPAAALAGAGVAGGTPFFPRRSGDDTGWTLGGGVEWAFTNNLTFKVEGLWIGFDREDNNNAFLFGHTGVVGVSNTGAPIVRNTSAFGFGDNGRDSDVFIARVGLNWKFGL
jgi:outer membrane immunogenic protein